MKNKLILSALIAILFISCNKRIHQHSSTPLSRAQLIEKYQFNWMSKFSEGKALVYNNNDCYVIDEYGNKLFDFPYMGDELNFNNNYAIIQDGLYKGVIDQEGKLIVPIDYLSIRKGCPELNKATTKNLSNGFLDITRNTFHQLDSLYDYAYPISTELIFDKKDGKSGLINNQGTVIVPYIYKSISPLHSGGLKTKRDNHYGIINGKNEILTPFMYDNMIQEKKRDIHIIVSLDGKKGIIDENNKILLPIEYNELSELSNNYIRFVKGTESGYLDENLQSVVYEGSNNTNMVSKHLSVFEENGKKGVKYLDGQIVQNAIFDDVRKYNRTQIEVKKDGLFNMLSDKGQLIFDQYYDRIHGVGDFAKVQKNGKWGLKTKWNNDIIDIAYDNIKVEKGAIITNNGKPYFGTFGLFDYNGTEILETKYESIESHANVFIINGQDSCMVLSRNFKKLYEGKGRLLKTQFQDNRHLFILVKNDKDYLLNLITNQESSKGYHDISELAFLENYFTVFSSIFNGGIMDSEENLILDTIYIGITPINKKYIKVQSSEGVALYNNKIEQIIPPKYSDLNYVDDNFIITEKEWLKGAVNIKGEELIEVKYAKVKQALGNKYVVAIKDKYGLIDSNDKVLVDFEFDKIWTYQDPFIIVSKNNLQKIVNVNTMEMTPEFDEIYHCSKSNAIIKADEKFGLMNTNGEIIIPPICENIRCKKVRKQGLDPMQFKVKLEDKRLLGYTITYKGHTFSLNANLECMKDCPDESILSELELVTN